MLQISSPSGKAVFKFTNKEGSTSEEEVDVVVCRFPEPDNLPLADGTVTAYRSGTFIWYGHLASCIAASAKILEHVLIEVLAGGCAPACYSILRRHF